MSKSDGMAAVRAFNDRLRSALHDAAKPQVLKALGDKAVEVIVRRTRLGYSVTNHGADRTKLKPLSNGYVWHRERVSRGDATFAGGLGMSALTTPRKSNLTATGQMLDSMTVLEVRANSVVVGPAGGRAGSSLTNQQVAAFVTEQGRPFNYLSRLEQEQLVRFYRNKFGDLLKNRRLQP